MRKNHWSARRIACFYVATSVVWAVFSDYLLYGIYPQSIFNSIALLVEVLFFLCSGFLLFYAISNWQAAQQEAELLLDKQLDAKKIQRLKNLYMALSLCNQSIVRCKSEMELFEQACRHVVEFGGMDMAWIGMVDSTNQQINPVVKFGKHSDVVDGIQITTDINTSFSCCSTEQAIHLDQAVWHQNIDTIENPQAWYQTKKAAGIMASASLPLHRANKIIGAFTFYSAETDVFDAEVQKLLSEIVADVDYAINNFANEAARHESELALSKNRAYLKAVIESEPECVKTVDSRGVLLDMNKAGLAMLETDSVAHVNQIGLKAFIAPEHLDAFMDLHQRVLNGATGTLEFEIIGLHGTRRWMETNSTRLLDSETGDASVLSITHDITERKRGEAQQRIAAQVFERSMEGILVTDAHKKIVLVNKAFTTTTGFTQDEAFGKKPSELINSGVHDQVFYQKIADTVRLNGFWQGEIWNRRKNGEIYPELLSISTVTDEFNKVTHYTGIFTDLTVLKKSEQKLEFLAHHDPLTSLPNRVLLLYRLQHGLESAKRNKKQLALMMLDLDSFKHINDSFGHLAGDELLQQVAERLTKRLRKMDTVARLGGDEFTLVLTDISEADDAGRLAKIIIDDLSEPFYLNTHGEVRIGASIGISVFPENSDTPEILLQQADTALYLAKSQGRGRYAYFTEDLTVAARARTDLEARLRKSIANNDLRLYYQPQVDIISGKIIGAEALVRWQDPVHGLVMPIKFIPFAEENGLILKIGEWALHEACRQGKQWQDAGLPSISLAVNVSPHQFMQCELDILVTRILLETGYSAAQLELELTESALMAREADAIRILHKLRALGIRLAIDDFGTGYSSLAYLKRFPVDVLKIDKCFIDGG
jgi:diguanylate cyclase (GGDEF)-like protein/PAS domain S-box-containing protein